MPAVGVSGRTYKIGEAAKLLQLKTCVLRFWEEEFPVLAPERTEKGQRLYSSVDMALLRRIRSLLHEQGMTIDGARRVLEGSAKLPRKVNLPSAGNSCPVAGNSFPVAGNSCPVAGNSFPVAGNSFPVAGNPASAGSAQTAPQSRAPDHELLQTVLEQLEIMRALLAGGSA